MGNQSAVQAYIDVRLSIYCEMQYFKKLFFMFEEIYNIFFFNNLGYLLCKPGHNICYTFFLFETFQKGLYGFINIELGARATV